MKHYLSFGAVPYEEECEQCGTSEYSPLKAKKECILYKKQLLRIIAETGENMPEGCELIVKANKHEYGTYYEVNISFSSDEKIECEFASWLEAHTPSNWDEEALNELLPNAKELANFWINDSSNHKNIIEELRYYSRKFPLRTMNIAIDISETLRDISVLHALTFKKALIDIKD